MLCLLREPTESRNKTNLEQTKILVPVSILMDSGLVLSFAVFHGKTLLVALSLGQGCAAISSVCHHAPGWKKTPEALAQRWCSSVHPGQG